uniref:uncharacterized protein LOC100179136 isoform X2 n=1 Tax=Ciona intestinalis TaxID=7719 RepID=UPI000EF54387|nr:uncharacterized protein LOC100179136 isoform X2 [Ciona intestinalis]|eukprot:XP_026693846.1 uncharacterized protein LOC100179136 isoform X2 [Ciona intestinalis]
MKNPESYFLCFLNFLLTSSAFTPACKEGLCRHNATCVERPYAMGGFYCACAQDYHGRFCDNKLPHVRCLRDRIVLVVGKSLVREEAGTVDRKLVYVGRGRRDEARCWSRDVGDELVVTLNIFSNCGTNIKKRGRNFVYKNRLFLDTSSNTSSSTSSPDNLVLLDWSCVYPRNYVTSLRQSISPAIKCPSELDPTVNMDQSSPSNKSLFSFQIFSWSRDLPVYLHCVVGVCNVTLYQQACQPTCDNITSSPARVRRSVDEANREPDIRLAIGPFLIRNNPSMMSQRGLDTATKRLDPALVEESKIRIEYVIMGTIAAISAICIFVICVAIYLRRRRHRTKHYDVDNRLPRRFHGDREIRSLSAGIGRSSSSSNNMHLPGTNFS